ncbi:hypothetical protein 2 [Hubei unio douglasiae virus 3]|uniref:hypothetical protein 2 n=1 Tax=Hubei unio douglasiae virus 3 TaxID=1923323 RepID=UPI00090AB49C|nr:hypothetical protein 2 [Hubei unio douglasiae virus 3]APG76518.1 hypothetical protein 2 [Hubei unio douglasiae virus 3]
MPPKAAEQRIVVAVAKGVSQGAANAAKQSKARKGGKAQRQRMSIVPRSVRQLDPPAMAWLKMLNDPCYGRLSHPVYPGADGGYLSRFESEATFVAGVGTTAGIIGFVPGVLPFAVVGSGVVSDITASALADLSAASAPGYTYLRGVANSVRCVSACMQVSWPGSELNRQGFVTLGQSTGAVLAEAAAAFGNTPVTPASLRPLCHLRTRMPETVAEVKWRPTLADAQWHDPLVAPSYGRVNEAGALLATFGNLPLDVNGNGIGVRVRFIVTYEWIPRGAQGLTSGFDDRARSSNTLDDVINTLDRNGPEWAYTIGRATSVLGMMGSAYVAGRRNRLMG